MPEDTPEPLGVTAKSATEYISPHEADSSFSKKWRLPPHIALPREKPKKHRLMAEKLPQGESRRLNQLYPQMMVQDTVHYFRLRCDEPLLCLSKSPSGYHYHCVTRHTSPQSTDKRL